MALRIYLRRDEWAGSGSVTRNRFWFIPVERITPQFNAEAINMALPSNDSGEFYGTGSTNILVNIGKQRLALNVEGTFQPLDAADFPDINALSSSDFHPGTGTEDGRPLKTANSLRYYDTPGSVGSAPSNAFRNAQAMTAGQQRQLFYEWIADQSRTDIYVNWRLGFRDWAVAGDYTEFRGNILGTPQTVEEAGFPDQYKYSFTFVIGDTIEVLT